MAVVTKRDKDNPMAEAEAFEEEERREASRPSAAAPAPDRGGGFFHVYKPGQGYWTRLGTAIGAGLLLILIAQFLYVNLRTRTNLDMRTTATGALEHGFPAWKLIIVGSIVLASAIVAWYYMNKPAVVDFLIATESEMKKVNWTSRKDLLGSTKVVILFMFLISAILFVIDVLFGYFFYLIHVLKTGPFA